METTELAIPVEQVKEELETLKKGIKEGWISKSSKIVRDLLEIYGHLTYKGKVIDIYQAFKKAGLNQNGHPKLAIVRADSTFCHLYKRKSGGALFSRERKDDWRSPPKGNFTEGDVELPNETFEWDMEKWKNRERFFKTVTPMIPPRISVVVSARIIPYHYHILFETDYWASDPAPPSAPKDPILGRLITPNLFAVYAHWNLTELEQSFLIGKLR